MGRWSLLAWGSRAGSGRAGSAGSQQRALPVLWCAGWARVPRGEAWRRLRGLALRPTALGTLLPATPGCPRGYTMLGSACSLGAFFPRGCHAAC